jgi:hypothetical protein
MATVGKRDLRYLECLCLFSAFARRLGTPTHAVEGKALLLSNEQYLLR